jgi:4a-hydroxytetrahydrobiopterin dehydratase
MALSLSLAPPTVTSFSRPPSVAMARSSGGARSRRMRGVVVAMADMLGDLGARDPFPAEVESNFADKTLGDTDTLHRILIPTVSVLSIARLPLEQDPAPLSVGDARRLLHKVVGWRLLLDDDGESTARLQCTWKVWDRRAARSSSPGSTPRSKARTARRSSSSSRRPTG